MEDPKKFFQQALATGLKLQLPSDYERAVEAGLDEPPDELNVFVERSGQPKVFIGSVGLNDEGRWRVKIHYRDVKRFSREQYRAFIHHDFATPMEAAQELLKVFNNGWWEDWMAQKAKSQGESLARSVLDAEDPKGVFNQFWRTWKVTLKKYRPKPPEEVCYTVKARTTKAAEAAARERLRDHVGARAEQFICYGIRQTI